MIFDTAPQVSKVLMYYFGNEAIELLDQSADTLIGDFLDSYEFYTTNELDDLREYVVEQVHACHNPPG